MATSKKTKWGIIGLVGLIGLIGMAGAASAAEPDGEPEPDDDEPDDGGIPDLPSARPAKPSPGIPEVDVFKPAPSNSAIVDKYVGNGTKTGALYQIRSGDNPTTVARRALGVNTGHPAIVPYIRAMAIPTLNFVLYDTIYVAGQGKYGTVPSYYTIMLNNHRRYIGDAFTPKHADVLDDLRRGIPLVRGTDLDGAGVNPSRRLGLLWLPRVDAFDSQNKPIVGDYNPPDELGDLIQFA